jgi:hypothetical protein
LFYFTPSALCPGAVCLRSLFFWFLKSVNYINSIFKYL